MELRKKILAALTAAAMLVSTAAMPALADDEDAAAEESIVELNDAEETAEPEIELFDAEEEPAEEPEEPETELFDAEETSDNAAAFELFGTDGTNFNEVCDSTTVNFTMPNYNYYLSSDFTYEYTGTTGYMISVTTADEYSIDFNGYTLYNNSSSNNRGTIRAYYSSSNATYSTLTLSNGKIESSKGQSSSYPVLHAYAGTINLDGMAVSCTDTGNTTNCAMKVSGISSHSATATIKDSTLSALAKTTPYALYLGSYSSTTISGDSKIIGTIRIDANTALLAIESGDFTEANFSGSYKKITISGGTFAVQPSTITCATIADGYEEVENTGEGTWTVQKAEEKTYLATTTISGTTKSYETVQEALTAASDSNNATVTLLNDVADAGNLSVEGPDVTLDLAGYSLTCGTIEIGEDEEIGDALTITDSSEGKTGSISCTGITVGAYSAISVDNTTIKSTGTCFSVAEGGTLTLDNATILATGSCFSVAEGGTVTLLTNGTFSEDVTAYCAAGYKTESDTLDGTAVYKVIEDTSIVATIGSTSYTSLNDALAAAVAGDTVTLIRNVDEETLTYSNNVSATLDLAGYAAEIDTLTVSTGKLTITDSVGTGSVTLGTITATTDTLEILACTVYGADPTTYVPYGYSITSVANDGYQVTRTAASFTLASYDTDVVTLQSATVTVDGKSTIINNSDNFPYEYSGYVGDTVEITATAEIASTYSGNYTLGWYYNKDGTGSAISENTQNADGTYTLTATITLTGDTTVYAVCNRETSDEDTACQTWINNGTYEISTVDEWKMFAYAVNVLGYTFSGKTVNLKADLDFGAATLSAAEFTLEPVGTETNPFKGTLEGNNYTISNMSYTATTSSNSAAYAGVFGVTSGATIQNLNVANSSFITSSNDRYNHAGGIAASAENGTVIKDCTVTGVTVEGWFAGGITGHSFSGTIENVTVSDITFASATTKSGYIIGYAGNVTISGATVTSDAAADSAGMPGAVIGQSNGNATLTDSVVETPNLNLIGTMETTGTYTVEIGGGDTEITAAAIAGNLSDANADLIISQGKYSVDVFEYLAADCYEIDITENSLIYEVNGIKESITENLNGNYTLDIGDNETYKTENGTVESTDILYTGSTMIDGNDVRIKYRDVAEEYIDSLTTTPSTITISRRDEVTNYKYENSVLTMDIEPYILYTVDNSSTPDKQELDLNGVAATVTIPIDANTFADGTKVRITHKTDDGQIEYFTTTVSNGAVEVETMLGFSTWTIEANNATDAAAQNISVVYTPVSGTDDQYYISLVGDGEIYRFMSAQLVFEIDNDEIGYTIAPYSDSYKYAVAITTADTTIGTETATVYEFNIDGKTNNGTSDVTAEMTAGATQSEYLTIGIVTFNGVGDFTFGVDGDYTMNQVQTAKTADVDNNIVRTYVTSNTTVTGTENSNLNVTQTLTGSVSLDPSKLTINVVFPNAVEEQSKDYTQMKVKVTGVDVDETVEFGNDDLTAPIQTAIPITYADNGDETGALSGYNGYTAQVDVYQDYAYTLEFSGDGYRTYRTTIVPTDSTATVTVWNNVMDDEMVVISKDDADSSVYKTLTFLAGDIVADENINLYDLSAVVSYFGKGDLTTNPEDYIKYDLNRDGKIDSKRHCNGTRILE